MYISSYSQVLPRSKLVFCNLLNYLLEIVFGQNFLKIALLLHKNIIFLEHFVRKYLATTIVIWEICHYHERKEPAIVILKTRDHLSPMYSD